MVELTGIEREIVLGWEKAERDRISREYNAAERLKKAREEGYREGLILGRLEASVRDLLEIKFGSASPATMAAVRKIADPKALQDLLMKLFTDIPLEEFEALAQSGVDRSELRGI